MPDLALHLTHISVALAHYLDHYHAARLTHEHLLDEAYRTSVMACACDLPMLDRALDDERAAWERYYDHGVLLQQIEHVLCAIETTETHTFWAYQSTLDTLTHN